MTLSRSRRAGFTLLEMILASTIGALLMAALYVSMDIQLRLADAGRESVEQGTLARQILTLISQDIGGTLTPITATKAAASTSTSTATASTTTSDDSVSSGTVTPLNAGVEGDSSVLTLYVSKVPPRASTYGEGDALSAVVADQRRVSYWLAADGGLARQELKNVTADDETSQLPPNVPDEQRLVFAAEVVGLEFRYFDGSTWTDSWSGSTLGADEATPIGPPRAIEITLTIRLPGTDDNGGDKTKTYRHVVAIGAANAQPVQTTDTTTTTSSTTTTGATP